MQEGTYKVKTNNYAFVMEIIDMDGIITIKYGIPHIGEYCIEMTYDTDNDYIKIDNLMYNPNCSEDRTLEKGTGTHEMLKSATKLIMQLFPNIKRFILNDVSAINCNNKNMFLAHYNLAKYGQTWYEKHFGAKPLLRKINERLEAFKRKLNSKEDIFPFSIGSHTSWHDYFVNKNCQFFVDHKADIEKACLVNLVYSEWQISRRIVESYDVAIKSVKPTKPVQRGGWPTRTNSIM